MYLCSGSRSAAPGGDGGAGREGDGGDGGGYSTSGRPTLVNYCAHLTALVDRSRLARWTLLSRWGDGDSPDRTPVPPPGEPTTAQEGAGLAEPRGRHYHTDIRLLCDNSEMCGTAKKVETRKFRQPTGVINYILTVRQFPCP